jgi:aryl-alcohol dehydrogenase-like predicted oxidoreductase
MRYISIPGLDKPVAQLVLGSMMLSEKKMEDAASLLDGYRAIGGNTIDTAHVYGPSGMGAIGLWMQARKNRASLAIIGKGAHPNHNGPRMNRQAIEQDLIESLDLMRTDYVDIYMLHRDDTDTPVGIIMEALQEQLDAKRCHALGVSNWTTARIDEANEFAASHGLTCFTCNSPNLSLAKPNEPRWHNAVSADEAYTAWHERTQMPLLSWSSQAGGFFTGRFTPDKREDSEAVRVYYSPSNWERYRRAKLLAEQRDCDANQIALAFVLHQRFPTCALIGPSNVSELSSSVKALDVPLMPEEIRWLDLETESLTSKEI